MIASHEQKNTITEDVFVPAHEDRVETSLFTTTRDKLISQESGRCFVCNATEAESGAPLEAHHVLIERCLTNAVDWRQFCLFLHKFRDIVDRADEFCIENPDIADKINFVANMLANGMLLCKEHHTGKDSGVHRLSFSMWLLQAFGIPGYKFSEDEIIAYHDEEIK